MSSKIDHSLSSSSIDVVSSQLDSFPCLSSNKSLFHDSSKSNSSNDSFKNSSNQDLKNSTLSFGINRLLSDSYHQQFSECVQFNTSQENFSSQVQDSDKCDLNLNQTEKNKGNDSVLKANNQFKFNSLNPKYPNPYSWVNSQVSTSFISKEGLSGKRIENGFF